MIKEIRKEIYYKNRFGNGETNKQEFIRSVADLTRDNNEVYKDIQFRIDACNALIDAYVHQSGEVPEPVQLNLLANWLLLEELTDTHPDKVARNEYPILNKRQLRKRYDRERCNEFIEDGTSNTASFPHQKQRQLFRRNEE